MTILARHLRIARRSTAKVRSWPAADLGTLPSHQPCQDLGELKCFVLGKFDRVIEWLVKLDANAASWVKPDADVVTCKLEIVSFRDGHPLPHFKPLAYPNADLR